MIVRNPDSLGSTRYSELRIISVEMRSIISAMLAPRSMSAEKSRYTVSATSLRKVVHPRCLAAPEVPSFR